jgi:hypothetical protein
MARDSNGTPKRGFFGSVGALALFIAGMYVSYRCSNYLYRRLAAPPWAREQDTTTEAPARTTGTFWDRIKKSGKTVPASDQATPQQTARTLTPREQLLETFMIGMRLEFTENLMQDTDNDVAKLQAFADRELFPRARLTAQKLIAELSDQDVDTLNRPTDQMTEADVAVLTRFIANSKAALEKELDAAVPQSSVPNFRLKTSTK